MKGLRRVLQGDSNSSNAAPTAQGRWVLISAGLALMIPSSAPTPRRRRRRWTASAPPLRVPGAGSSSTWFRSSSRKPDRLFESIGREKELYRAIEAVIPAYYARKTREVSAGDKALAGILALLEAGRGEGLYLSPSGGEFTS